MKVNQKGFSVVEISIVVVVVGLLGVVGWLVYDNQKSKDNSAQSTQPETQNTQQTDDKEAEKKLSADWLLRKSSDASIRVPDGFNILALTGEDFDFVLPDEPQGTLKYTEGTLAKVVGEPHKHFELGLIVGYNSEGFNDRGAKIKEFKTYSGLNVSVKLFEQTAEPEGVDFAKGTKYLKYTVTKDSNYINIDYVYLGSGYVDIIEEMVKSAEIN